MPRTGTGKIGPFRMLLESGEDAMRRMALCDIDADDHVLWSENFCCQLGGHHRNSKNSDRERLAQSFKF